MDILKNAKDLQEELVAHRRYLHEHAEIGFALKNTTAYVCEKLEEMGYEPRVLGKSGVVATVGKGKRSFLLRADMDALPIKEETGETFACEWGNMHACGHDLHTAMLLGAAKLLKMHEGSLKGQIRLFFQTAEEILKGAKTGLKEGVLRPLKPSAGAMLHVLTNTELPVDSVVVASGTSAPAADFFEITVRGKGCHGSTPWEGVDTLTAAAHILLALQELSARELPAAVPAVLTIGSLQAGEAGNVIADFAKMKGTLRAYDEETREFLKSRLTEMVKGTAKVFRATAKIEFTSGCPTLVNDETLSAFALRVVKELLGEERVFSMQSLGGTDVAKRNGGSEDFAYISHEIPCVMLAVSAGERVKGYEYPLHHPKARFDEACLSIGAAAYAYTALRWLEEE